MKLLTWIFPILILSTSIFSQLSANTIEDKKNFNNNSYCMNKDKNESVVLIHGFFGSPWNLYFLKRNFKKKGYKAFSFGYKSRNKNIQEHAKDLKKFVDDVKAKNPNCKIHFIAHSMGSLVLRAYMNEEEKVNDCKVVLFGPPNKGCSYARSMSKFKIVKKILKKYSGKELSINESFDYLGKFPKQVKVLVVAGDIHINPFIKGKNDRLIKVDETYLDTEHKHVVIKKGHLGLVFSKQGFALAYNHIKE